ncbi:efflux RND transporter permease subunit [Gemmata sp.]|uniref:efflux RND transporter permease subunit n=1 Tax=Gemmata sp. TaxID=1914242 RepID=UPI003F70275A
MISRFFIDRPIFANVIAIVTLLFGTVALYKLPVERYPSITPPTVQVTTNYPGANAKVVADTVAAPIEQQINGVENMMYMSSTSSSDGSYSLTITFEIGTNLEEAQVLVQNRVAIAEPQLPEEVRRQGVSVKKQSSNIIMAISLTSPPPKSAFDLTLDPAGLADRGRGVTADEALAAVRTAGGTGGVKVEPHADAKPGFYRVSTPDGFAPDGPAGADKLRAVVVKKGPDGTSAVPLSDVARVDPLPGAFDGLFLSNYATLKLRDELSRVAGVGDIAVRGVGAYAMRVWLDPDKLAARDITTQEVTAALARQNVQVAAGQVGQPPNPSGQRFQLTVNTLGRLSDPSQFREIIVRSGGGGQPVYLRDVAEVELGAQTYDSFSSRSGFAAANLLVYQLPNSNALDVAARVRAAMEKVKPSLPPGVEYSIPFDTTKFVESAIHEVYVTLGEAGVLVLIVILIFLQSWRALFVPATTVPITIIGAFAFMPFLGFSINLLTLFGLILAIGIVVDDAIVIVENASHHIEQGLAPREATIKAMDEVTGPVISITLVLMAVFIPTAFLSGITGEMYRQFALTIAATALISAVNALTLKPAQCALWLKPVAKKNVFTRLFDAVYRPVERVYAWSVRQLLKVWPVVLLVFVGVAGVTGVLYQKTPTGFLPVEDQGYIIIAAQLPDSASLDRTNELVDKINTAFRNTPGVENWFVLGGFSLLDGTAAPNAATAFIAWKDWKERTTPDLQQEVLVKRVEAELGSMREAFTLVLVPPSIQGLGFAGGFQMQIEDREGVGLDVLQERTQAIMMDVMARQQAAAGDAPKPGGLQAMFQPAARPSSVAYARTLFRAGVPQVYLNIDRQKAEKMGVKMNDVFATLQTNLGSVYVNDFNKFGRTYQVRVQADARFRADPSVIKRLEVPGREDAVGTDGKSLPRPRVPLGTLLSDEVQVGPQSIIRYNLYPTAQLQGQAAEGASSGDALREMEEIADRALPATMGYEWSGISFQEKRVSGEAVLVYGLAVFLVYLVLAAQYESWLLPFAVILVVPLGLLGVVGAVQIRGFDNNIYTQIGIVLIIALASKNAILIVEFARELRLAGRSIHGAAAEAARMRFRPIIMTSFAFILGVAPLVFATGAGAASRQALGTAVFGGMITSTVLAVFFVPVFYVAIQWLIELKNGPPKLRPGEVIHVHLEAEHGHRAVAPAPVEVAPPPAAPEPPPEPTAPPAVAPDPKVE